jgi:hypothetical protein
MKKHHLTLIVTAIITATMLPVAAQTEYGGTSEQPTTIQARVENVRIRQDSAIAELVSVFSRVSTQPELISSKELVDAIDQGDRALKNTKAACDAILTTLRSEARTISGETSFSEDQKAELLESVEALIAKSEELSARSVATAKHLNGAYNEMKKWRKIHKTYLNLDGQTKALGQLKSSVDEFTKVLTAEPGAFDSAPAKDTDEDKAE